MINFKNKNILITGASGGIGKELVKKFVSLGGNVLGSGTKIEKLDLLKKQYPNIKVKKFDMAEDSKIKDFIDIPEGNNSWHGACLRVHKRQTPRVP